jgi:hypothetical protein
MRFFDLHAAGVGGNRLHRYPVPPQHRVQIEPVDAAQRINAVDRRHRPLVLDIGQATDENYKLLISAGIGDHLAGRLDIAELQVQPFARAPQALSRTFHAVILSPGDKRGSLGHDPSRSV